MRVRFGVFPCPPPHPALRATFPPVGGRLGGMHSLKASLLEGGGPPKAVEGEPRARPRPVQRTPVGAGLCAGPHVEELPRPPLPVYSQIAVAK